MSSYPGDGPQAPDDQAPDDQPRDDQAPDHQPRDDQPTDDPPGTEPTQPVGYWERQAEERAQEQEQAQGRPDPTTPYPQSPAYGQQPYAGQPPGYPPLSGQPAPYQPQPGPYQPQPGSMPYSAFAPPVPDHPQATLSLILGLVGLVGALVFCGLPLVVSPFAWAIGRSAVKEIEGSHGRLGGSSNARAGMILGIIGTVLLVLALILVVVVILAVVISADSTTYGSSV